VKDTRKAPTVAESASPTEKTNAKPKRTFAKATDEPLTKEERKHPLAECENCPLGRVGKYVPSRFPDGTNPTGLAFVGEAPARNEIRQGEPFVGPSGQLLDAVLNHYGVDRNNILLTNACSCHYPDSMKKLPKEAIDACRPRLLQELLDAQVDTVVTMGNSASAPLLPKEEAGRGITKLRAGPPKKVSIPIDERLVNLELIPTFHPAYCLRSQGMFPLMLGDISKALHKERPIMWYEPSIIVVDDPMEAFRKLDEIRLLNKGEGIVVDTESGRDKDTSFGRDDGPFGRVLCIGIGPTDPVNEDSVFVFTDHALSSPQVRNQLCRTLNDCGIIAQNGKYDVGVLMTYLDQEEPFPLEFDTMLASYCLYEVGGIHGLEYMGVEVLGTPDWKVVVKPYLQSEEGKEMGYAAIPRDVLYKYNAFDVHVTRLLKGYYSNLIEEQGLVRLNNWLTHRVSPMLTKVEARGMGFDLERSIEIGTELESQIEELREKFPYFDYTLKKGTKHIQLNPGSWQQVMQWLAQHGIQTESTDEDHLKAIIDHRKTPEDVKEVMELTLETRGVSKLKSTYVDALQNKLTSAGRVHTTYLIHGTTTGRLSSRGPNLQNIPRSGPIKTQFIPGKGKKLIGLDFAQAELRVLTWLAKDTTLQGIFNDDDQDLFTELSARMTPGFDQLNPEVKVDADLIKKIRTRIKTFAYGVSYGRTAEGIAADPDFGMTVSEAQKQMDMFNATIPQVKEFQADVIRRIHAGEDLINPFGRHRRFYLITDANRTSVENEAMAYLPQSTASDIGLEAACRISKEGVYLVNLVHDALYAEASPDEVDDIIALMDRIMVETGEEVTEGFVKFKTDHKIGDRWSDV
jgi:uracil-DNA glycosylase family 4